MKAFIKKVIKYTALTAAVAALSLSAIAGCSSEPEKKPSEPEDMGVVVEPPKAGTPADYSALENIEFMKGKLAARAYYHVDSTSNVTATAGVKQKVEGTKDYLDGILITETISYGAKIFIIETPSKAMQRYFGETEVFVRDPASDDHSKWNLDMEWSNAAPGEGSVLSYEEYEEDYGLPADELSDFVISDETIDTAEELVKEGDNYVLTLTLDNEKAPAYYVRQMKTMGDLKDFPKFKSIRLTITFDAEWAVLSIKTEEEYTSQKGIITANCSGGSTITYSYDREDVDISAYESYFKQYETKAE